MHIDSNHHGKDDGGRALSTEGDMCQDVDEDVKVMEGKVAMTGSAFSPSFPKSSFKTRHHSRFQSMASTDAGTVQNLRGSLIARSSLD